MKPDLKIATITTVEQAGCNEIRIQKNKNLADYILCVDENIPNLSDSFESMKNIFFY